MLFVVVAVTDYFDGKLARTRGMVTDLGKLLDPLADKLLLLATFVPMFVLVGSGHSLSLWSPHMVSIADGMITGVGPGGPGPRDVFPYITPVRRIRPPVVDHRRRARARGLHDHLPLAGARDGA